MVSGADTKGTKTNKQAKNSDKNKNEVIYHNRLWMIKKEIKKRKEKLK